MKKFIYFAIPFLALVLMACFIPRHITAEAAVQKGPPRSVCMTKCLRTYEKCQSRAGGFSQTTACYHKYLVCQQACD